MPWPGVLWRGGVLLAGVLLISVSCRGDNPGADKGSRADRVFVMADEGDSTAQTALGLLYERGIGIARNSAMALTWYRRAAAQGDALAEFHIGSLYERGAGVATDYAEAAKWYQRASDRGNESAQAALAYLYDRGLGVERDFAEAEALYGQASASWAEDDNYPADAIFVTGREGVALASSTVIPMPLGKRRAEFIAGKEEEPAIEIDLAALDDMPPPLPSATVFDGPEPIAGRGENFPLTALALIQPEPTHVPEAHEPPGNAPLAAVDVDDGHRFLPTAPKPRRPNRALPLEKLSEVRLQSPEAAAALTQGAAEKHNGKHGKKDSESDEGLFIASQSEPEIFLISLATFESEVLALAAWEKISTTHAGLLHKLPFELRPIDLSDLASSDDADANDGDGAVGQYVELIVGPVDSSLKSRTLCAVLRAHGHVCRTIEK